MHGRWGLLRQNSSTCKTEASLKGIWGVGAVIMLRPASRMEERTSATSFYKSDGPATQLPQICFCKQSHFFGIGWPRWYSQTRFKLHELHWPATPHAFALTQRPVLLHVRPTHAVKAACRQVCGKPASNSEDRAHTICKPSTLQRVIEQFLFWVNAMGPATQSLQIWFC